MHENTSPYNETDYIFCITHIIFCAISGFQMKKCILPTTILCQVFLLFTYFNKESNVKFILSFLLLFFSFFIKPDDVTNNVAIKKMGIFSYKILIAIIFIMTVFSINFLNDQIFNIVFSIFLIISCINIVYVLMFYGNKKIDHITNAIDLFNVEFSHFKNHDLQLFLCLIHFVMYICCLL